MKSKTFVPKLIFLAMLALCLGSVPATVVADPPGDDIACFSSFSDVNQTLNVPEFTWDFTRLPAEADRHFDLVSGDLYGQEPSFGAGVANDCRSSKRPDFSLFIQALHSAIGTTYQRPWKRSDLSLYTQNLYSTTGTIYRRPWKWSGSLNRHFLAKPTILPS